MRKFAAAALVLVSGFASAQSSNSASQSGVISTLVHGTCSSLVIAGNDMSAQCSPVLANVAYPGGGASFMFTLAGKAMISFFGKDTPAVGDHAMVYLQRFSFRDPTTTNLSSEVSGVCKYGNPFAGPTLVICDADSKDGPFKAVFTTDGQQPQVTKR